MSAVGVQGGVPAAAVVGVAAWAVRARDGARERLALGRAGPAAVSPRHERVDGE
ncbi:MAG TPA: hypothetical protein VFS43_10435 [Polyangiaceae bacterium]|nr:hypothetical protein [Polyangiaceae bacterium]